MIATMLFECIEIEMLLPPTGAAGRETFRVRVIVRNTLASLSISLN